jgi:hypothetical protein
LFSLNFVASSLYVPKIAEGRIMSDYEDRDTRVVRRWRDSKLRARPPAPASPEEAAWVQEHMKGFKPKPYVHPWDDTIYQDEDDDYPWAREGWDPVAASRRDYIPPSDPKAVTAPTGTSPSDLADASNADHGLMTQPVKTDAAWTDPSPAERARITALIAADWPVSDMATLMEMTEPQFRWAFHDNLKTGALAMKARLTTTMFADALSAKGSERNRVADFMGVFKPKAAPAASAADPNAEKDKKRRGSADAGTGKPARRGRYGGPMPKPDPEGRIPIQMVLGDIAMQTMFDKRAQIEAQCYHLLIELRASRGQDRNGNKV